MNMNQYLEIFIEETKEHLLGLNQSLLQLEKEPQNNKIVNEIFRIAHTLKGMSATMGFNKMAKLTHDMENVLDALRNNKLNVTTNITDLLFRCFDVLEEYLDNIINIGNEGNTSSENIIQELSNMVKEEEKPSELHQGDLVSKEAMNTIKNTNKDTNLQTNFRISEYEQNVINKAIELGMNVLEITIVLNKSCVLKSARAFIIFQMLERHSEIIRSEPSVQDIEDERFGFEFKVVVITKETADELLRMVNSISEVEEVSLLTYNSENPVNIKINDQEVNVYDSNKAEKYEDDEKSSEFKLDVKKTKTGKTVRVDIDRLSTLMNLVSELIIIKTRLEGLDGIERTQNYNEAVEYLERITTNLHDAVMKVRMVPIEMVFNRFPRMIRDISKDLGKNLLLNMSGEETELDRTVVDEIGEPLIHLLRNSADHGIESKEERRNAGKSEAGHIDLRAYQDGNSVVIEVEDDGGGIDIQKVREKAIEKGIVNKDIANSLSQKDIIDFLFAPNFSTASKITDLSGRGVGLDVVKTKIEALGGAIEVETEAKKGSKFIIRLPLTLAIIQALLVLIGEEKYAIPLNSIKEIINIQEQDIKFIQKQEVILLRNTVLPIIRLDKVLDVPKEEQSKTLTVVVVKKGDKLSGFLVDKLIGQQEIVIKSLGKLLSGVKLIAGATILGNGNVALILDVNSIA